MANTITITHPSGAPSVKVHPPSATLRRMDCGAASLTFTVGEQFSLYDDESDPNNPIVAGAAVVQVRGAQTIFEGRLITTTRNQANANMVDVVCADRLFDLDGAVASYDGVYNFVASCAEVELTDVPLSLLSVTTGLQAEAAYPVYPAFSTATNTPSSTSPWIARSVSRTTTLAAAITGTPTTISVADGRKLTAPGFLHVDSELIYFTNVYRNSSTVWTLTVGARGVLGTSSANHSDGATVYQRELKCISDAAPVDVTHASGRIDPLAYNVRSSAGRFDWREDPSGLSSPVADYHVYDQDATGALTLGSFITELVTAPATALGPAFTAGQLDITGLDTIRIPRIVLEQPQYCLETIRQAIEESWPKAGSGARRIIYYYDSNAGDLIFKSLSQSGTPSMQFTHAVQQVSGFDLSAMPSGALVNYYSDEPAELLSADRCWHPTVGDAANVATPGSSATALVTAIKYQNLERADAKGWLRDTGTTSNNVYTDKLFDKDNATGWGIEYEDSAQVGAVLTNVLFCWFPSVQTIDEVDAVVDIRNWVRTGYRIEIVGYTTYTPGDPPTLGDVVKLSGNLAYMIFETADRGSGRPIRYLRDVR